MKIKIIVLVLFLLSACGGLKDAGKVLRNEKTSTTDEFLVKKKKPLVLPPDYNKIPEPDSVNSNNNEEQEIKKILKVPTNEQKNSVNSSIEQSILREIKK